MKWEYRQIFCPADAQSIDKCLAEQGSEGWELAGLMPVMVQHSPLAGIGPGPHGGTLMVFKRPAHVPPAGIPAILPDGSEG